MLTGDLWPANSLSVWRSDPMAAFSDWLARQPLLSGTQFRESSCETYTAMFHTWVTFLKGRRMHALEARPVDATDFFVKHKTLQPVSRRRYLQLLDRVYIHLRELGWPEDNPLAVELAKERALELDLPPGLAPPEQAILLETLVGLPGWKGMRDRGLCALLMGAGLRTNEVANLSRQKVRDDYSILITPATVHSEHRSLLLPDGPWRNWFDNWLAERERLAIPGDWVVPGTSKGRPFSPSGLFRRTSAWFDAAGLSPKQRGPHILRNTFARNALACGRYTVQEVQEFLGHAELRATSRYSPSS